MEHSELIRKILKKDFDQSRASQRVGAQKKEAQQCKGSYGVSKNSSLHKKKNPGELDNADLNSSLRKSESTTKMSLSKEYNQDSKRCAQVSKYTTNNSEYMTKNRENPFEDYMLKLTENHNTHDTNDNQIIEMPLQCVSPPVGTKSSSIERLNEPQCPNIKDIEYMIIPESNQDNEDTEAIHYIEPKENPKARNNRRFENRSKSSVGLRPEPENDQEGLSFYDKEILRVKEKEKLLEEIRLRRIYAEESNLSNPCINPNSRRICNESARIKNRKPIYEREPTRQKALSRISPSENPLAGCNRDKRSTSMVDFTKWTQEQAKWKAKREYKVKQIRDSQTRQEIDQLKTFFHPNINRPSNNTPVASKGSSYWERLYYEDMKRKKSTIEKIDRKYYNFDFVPKINKSTTNTSRRYLKNQEIQVSEEEVNESFRLAPKDQASSKYLYRANNIDESAQDGKPIQCNHFRINIQDNSSLNEFLADSFVKHLIK